MRALDCGAVASAILLATTACQVIGGFETLERGGAAGGAGAGGEVNTGGAGGKGGSTGGNGGNATGGAPSGGTGGGALPACPAGADPGVHGVEMAEWQRPDGSCFWIDKTEVTVEDYAEFVAAPSHAPQSSVCTGNTDFNPACPSAAGDAGTPSPTAPVTCVDWCDAEAYCAWAGKELCSDSTVQTDWTKWQASDWYAVCSSNGKNDYPYGRTQSPDACATSGSPNGCPAGTCSVADVGSYSTCGVSAQGGSVLDLIGNVEEWTLACSPNTATGACNTRGGFYGTNVSCQGGVNRVGRQEKSSTVGFRCCATATAGADGG